MVKGEPIPVYGDGQQVRDWLYVEDHCAAIECVVMNGKVGDTYCIGGNNEWKNIDLLNVLCDTVDANLAKPIGTCRKLLTYVKDRAGHDRRYAIDTTKIENTLHWKAETTFQEGLDLTVKWYLARL